MAPGQKVKAAFKAMKDIGIPEEKTKPALKKLLKLFDKNWDLIEEENYRVLADAIFEYEDTEVSIPFLPSTTSVLSSNLHGLICFYLVGVSDCREREEEGTGKR